MIKSYNQTNKSQTEKKVISIINFLLCAFENDTFKSLKIINNVFGKHH